MKFCPRCGKKNIKGDYCSACTLIVNPLPKDWKHLEMTFCSRCSATLLKNKWQPSKQPGKDLETSIRTQFIKRLKLNHDVRVTPILDALKTGPGISQEIEIEVKAPRHGLYGIPATITFTICPKCSKHGTEYFEGALQLRSAHEKEIRQDILDAVRNEIAKHAERGVHCTKEDRVGNGIDFQITSQKHVQTIGRKLHEMFGGTLKINSRIFTRNRQTSKDVYRVNVFLELPKFVKGDVVQIDDKIILVTKVGKKIIGDDLIHNKGVTVDYQQKMVEVLPVRKATISQVYPHLEVLEPESYQPVHLENPPKRHLQVGDKVKIIEYKGQYWVIE
ncbi:hypothetical protein HY488_02965 [Candidatus Woesearchaeota archaeon]|nr:hypothetical protein [Candidatus Woesearchaeota archaeon]